MSHNMDVPDLIWEWAQRKSGKKIPAPFLREGLYDLMIHDVQARDDTVPAPEEPEDYEAQWRTFGMGVDEFDERFNLARKAFIETHGSDDKALQWIKDSVDNRGIKAPRNFVMSWWYKNQQDQ